MAFSGAVFKSFSASGTTGTRIIIGCGIGAVCGSSQICRIGVLFRVGVTKGGAACKGRGALRSASTTVIVNGFAFTSGRSNQIRRIGALFSVAVGVIGYINATLGANARAIINMTKRVDIGVYIDIAAF